MEATFPNGRTNSIPDGGTFSTFFRKDRIRCTRGENLLKEVNVRPDSFARRMVSGCCNSAMTIRYTNWLPMVPLWGYGDSRDTAPPDCRSFTKFSPDPEIIPKDVHAYRGPALGFAVKILWNALLLRFAPR